MPANRMMVSALLALSIVLLACGCGDSGASSSTGGPGSGSSSVSVSRPDGLIRVAEGEPLTFDGLRYRFASRYLSLRDKRDAAYLASGSAPSEGLHYAAVFVEIQNEGDESQVLPTMFITDAAGTEHAAFPPATPYSRAFGEVVEPHETQPAPDSGQQKPIRPELLIFRLAPETDQLPLTLHIQGEGGKSAEVTLALQ
jgi:hypothetical protein